MYWECEGNIYTVDDAGVAHGVNVVAKDKVVQHREIESITPEVLEGEVKLPTDAQAITLEEIVCRFGLSEENPVMFKGVTKKSGAKSSDKTEGSKSE